MTVMDTLTNLKPWLSPSFNPARMRELPSSYLLHVYALKSRFSSTTLDDDDVKHDGSCAKEKSPTSASSRILSYVGSGHSIEPPTPLLPSTFGCGFGYRAIERDLYNSLERPHTPELRSCPRRAFHPLPSLVRGRRMWEPAAGETRQRQREDVSGWGETPGVSRCRSRASTSSTLITVYESSLAACPHVPALRPQSFTCNAPPTAGIARATARAFTAPSIWIHPLCICIDLRECTQTQPAYPSLRVPLSNNNISRVEFPVEPSERKPRMGGPWAVGRWGAPCPARGRRSTVWPDILRGRLGAGARLLRACRSVVVVTTRRIPLSCRRGEAGGVPRESGLCGWYNEACRAGVEDGACGGVYALLVEALAMVWCDMGAFVDVQYAAVLSQRDEGDARPPAMGLSLVQSRVFAKDSMRVRWYLFRTALAGPVSRVSDVRKLGDADGADPECEEGAGAIEVTPTPLLHPAVRPVLSVVGLWSRGAIEGWWCEHRVVVLSRVGDTGTPRGDMRFALPVYHIAGAGAVRYVPRRGRVERTPRPRLMLHVSEFCDIVTEARRSELYVVPLPPPLLHARPLSLESDAQTLGDADALIVNANAVRLAPVCQAFSTLWSFRVRTDAVCALLCKVAAFAAGWGSFPYAQRQQQRMPRVARVPTWTATSGIEARLRGIQAGWDCPRSSDYSRPRVEGSCQRESTSDERDVRVFDWQRAEFEARVRRGIHFPTSVSVSGSSDAERGGSDDG
ncbi:hypothetical protein R3P38DRAFT_3378613 [Favolaschia claudopus]|uniref:Uncharacterized protein n=1 Tax=Favolaschia claudopus TaxID=2862362 RepID=A0AAV9Z8M6_9AGAR